MATVLSPTLYLTSATKPARTFALIALIVQHPDWLKRLDVQASLALLIARSF